VAEGKEALEGAREKKLQGRTTLREVEEVIAALRDNEPLRLAMRRSRRSARTTCDRYGAGSFLMAGGLYSVTVLRENDQKGYL